MPYEPRCLSQKQRSHLNSYFYKKKKIQIDNIYSLELIINIKTPKPLKRIRRTASQYHSPDSLIGYGIPDLELADLLLAASKPTASRIHVFPNPATQYINIWFHGTDEAGNYYEIIDVNGRKMQEGRIYSNNRNQAEIYVELLTAGTYLILVHTRYERMKGIFIKQ